MTIHQGEKNWRFKLMNTLITFGWILTSLPFIYLVTKNKYADEVVWAMWLGIGIAVAGSIYFTLKRSCYKGLSTLLRWISSAAWLYVTYWMYPRKEVSGEIVLLSQVVFVALLAWDEYKL